MTWQVLRLTSAPIVDPESVPETPASSHCPSGLQMGVSTHRLESFSSQRLEPSSSLMVDQPAVAKGILTGQDVLAVRRDGLEVLLPEYSWLTPLLHVDLVNGVLVLPAWHHIEQVQPVWQPANRPFLHPAVGKLAHIRAVRVDDEEVKDAHAAVEYDLLAIRRPDRVEIAIRRSLGPAMSGPGQVQDQDTAFSKGIGQFLAIRRERAILGVLEHLRLEPSRLEWSTPIFLFSGSTMAAGQHSTGDTRREGLAFGQRLLSRMRW